MSQNIKYAAAAGQVIFAWIYANSTNYCIRKSCSANSYLSFVLILAALAVLDWYFLKFYPRFKKIPTNIFTGIVLIFPLIFYLCGILLNLLTGRALSIIIVGVLLAAAYRLLWMYLAKGKIPLKLTEYLALTSLYLLIFSVIFLIANLNFAISAYLTYDSPNTDIYIVGNKGIKSSFLNYKFR